jgi:hypothetical protein
MKKQIVSLVLLVLSSSATFAAGPHGDCHNYVGQTGSYNRISFSKDFKAGVYEEVRSYNVTRAVTVKCGQPDAFHAQNGTRLQCDDGTNKWGSIRVTLRSGSEPYDFADVSELRSVDQGLSEYPIAQLACLGRQ